MIWKVNFDFLASFDFQWLMNLFGNMAAILISIVWNSYYEMLRGENTY